MGLPYLLLLFTFLSPLASVSATPLSLVDRQISDASSSGLFFGEHEPTSNMMLDPPRKSAVQNPAFTWFRALGKGQEQQQGSNLMPGITIEGILNVTEVAKPTYDLDVMDGSGTNVTWALQKKECANERVEYYTTGRTSWQAMIKDLARPKTVSHILF